MFFNTVFSSFYAQNYVNAISKCGDTFCYVVDYLKKNLFGITLLENTV